MLSGGWRRSLRPSAEFAHAFVLLPEGEIVAQRDAAGLLRDARVRENIEAQGIAVVACIGADEKFRAAAGDRAIEFDVRTRASLAEKPPRT